MTNDLYFILCVFLFGYIGGCISAVWITRFAPAPLELEPGFDPNLPDKLESRRFDDDDVLF
jgi:hypothetical protein